ncbi:hypothetical protein F5B22DRAFT_223479 [Xylaria bambusicola]|uniref:uncharacterized protein n=1 Tax=Xylaria bambusicola TaxID=326684 RepID=UPI0020071E1F|nr:uncharacterized protein F5B22DRAFT_223479 [Xylaria bambusicola]KAI0514865.1 hypothetical protein F5B22DRAFT_223479 [Xylaria bambusicola]
MGSAEEYEKERSNAHQEGDEAPPPYSIEASRQEIFEAASTSTASKRTEDDAGAWTRPTVESPFNFPPASAPGPSYSDLPEVVPTPGSSSSSSSNSPPPVFLAIPQVAPKPTSPFPLVYSRALLLRRGIPQETFTSFLTTLSAFLTATVSERALKHAVDVGRSLNSIPKKFSEDTLTHVKDVGRHVGSQAKKGKFVSAGIGVLAGAVSIPLATSIRAVGAAVQIPAAVSGSLAKKPLSPRERADAYLAIADKDWFNVRGLTASLCGTAELLQMLDARHGDGSGSSKNEAVVRQLVDLARQTSKGGPDDQFRALQNRFGLAPLEIVEGTVTSLDIGVGTLWLVLTEIR